MHILFSWPNQFTDDQSSYLFEYLFTVVQDNLHYLL